MRVRRRRQDGAPGPRRGRQRGRRATARAASRGRSLGGPGRGPLVPVEDIARARRRHGEHPVADGVRCPQAGLDAAPDRAGRAISIRALARASRPKRSRPARPDDRAAGVRVRSAQRPVVAARPSHLAPRPPRGVGGDSARRPPPAPRRRPRPCGAPQLPGRAHGVPAGSPGELSARRHRQGGRASPSAASGPRAGPLEQRQHVSGAGPPPHRASRWWCSSVSVPPQRRVVSRGSRTVGRIISNVPTAAGRISE